MLYTQVSSKLLTYWHCSHSMGSRVYETLGASVCLFVCTSVPSFGRCTPLWRVCCCRLGGQEMSIDSGGVGCSRRRSMALSSKCKQCHDYSWHMKSNSLKCDIFLDYKNLMSQKNQWYCHLTTLQLQVWILLLLFWRCRCVPAYDEKKLIMKVIHLTSHL